MLSWIIQEKKTFNLLKNFISWLLYWVTIQPPSLFHLGLSNIDHLHDQKGLLKFEKNNSHGQNLLENTIWCIPLKHLKIGILLQKKKKHWISQISVKLRFSIVFFIRIPTINCFLHSFLSPVFYFFVRK